MDVLIILAFKYEKCDRDIKFLFKKRSKGILPNDSTVHREKKNIPVSLRIYGKLHNTGFSRPLEG